MLILPRETGRLLAVLAVVGFGVWEARRFGWTPDTWTSLRFPWRRW